MNIFRLVVTSLVSVFVSCSSGPLSSNLATSFDYYGDTVLLSDTVALANLLLEIESGSDSVYGTFSAPITSICQKKGCWMDLDLGNRQNATVRFMDYGFFVPMNVVGERAIVCGSITIDTLNVDWLRHKAHDAGDNDSVIALITEDEVSYSIIATGVALKQIGENIETTILNDTHNHESE
ncbi:MAG: Uncharacterised protein [Owenweeksia sp. TMED14]|nr:MAG: Uncharacterised protein [Owenweeksia sp. TMED14]|tara:strand:+ start:1121 stop:1660 length:540 start_codon:yes stop_codon:yes gene_type:complete